MSFDRYRTHQNEQFLDFKSLNYNFSGNANFFYVIVFFSIFVFQLVCSVNFWRYVITDSPGETNIEVITTNACIFTAITLLTGILFLRNYSKL